VPNHHVLFILHACQEPREFILPMVARDIPWRLFINTAAESPADIYPGLDGPPAPPNGVVAVESRSLVCYVAPDLNH
jgi:glycogen operon protein